MLFIILHIKCQALHIECQSICSSQEETQFKLKSVKVQINFTCTAEIKNLNIKCTV